jgi:hypothetical protein
MNDCVLRFAEVTHKKQMAVLQVQEESTPYSKEKPQKRKKKKAS